MRHQNVSRRLFIVAIAAAATAPVRAVDKYYDVHGTLSNADGAKTIVTGNATANFYDDVTNDPGSEFRVSANSTAVFFGNLIGLGQFNGTGVKDFEGTTFPGPIKVGRNGRYRPGTLRKKP